MATKEDIAASTVLEQLDKPHATDAERGLALMKVAGKMTGIYDANGNHIFVRAEQIKQYLAKPGFSISAPATAEEEEAEKPKRSRGKGAATPPVGDTPPADGTLPSSDVPPVEAGAS